MLIEMYVLYESSYVDIQLSIKVEENLMVVGYKVSKESLRKMVTEPFLFYFCHFRHLRDFISSFSGGGASGHIKIKA